METDYPHSDSTWPENPERLARYIGDLDPDTVAAITHKNAMRHFDFDPFAHIASEDANVGALRAKAAHVEVGPSKPRRPFVAPPRPLTLTDMLLRAEHPLLDDQAKSEGVDSTQIGSDS